MVTRAINNQDLIQDLILGSSRNVVTSEAHEPSELTKTYSSGGGVHQKYPEWGPASKLL